MTARGRNHVGHLLGREPTGVEPGFPVHHESDGPQRPLLGVYSDPSREIVGRLHMNLAPNQLAELRFEVLGREPKENTLALTSTVERHHETGLLLRASEPRNPEAERAVPPSRR